MTRAAQILFAAFFSICAARCLNAQAGSRSANEVSGGEKPAFEFVSITRHDPAKLASGSFYIGDPGGLTGKGVTAKDLIRIAYSVKDFQISGGPLWITTEAYDIDAKMAEAQAKLPAQERLDLEHLMMQSLLSDRFKLQVSRSTEQQPVYALVLIKGGPKLKDVTPSDLRGTAPDVGGGTSFSGDVDGHEKINAKAMSIPILVELLSECSGRAILDETGLKGRYDFRLQYKEPSAVPGNRGADWLLPDSFGASVVTALQKQLGLTLESTTGSVDMLVIDNIEEPMPNSKEGGGL